MPGKSRIQTCRSFYSKIYLPTNRLTDKLLTLATVGDKPECQPGSVAQIKDCPTTTLNRAQTIRGEAIGSVKISSCA